MLRPSLNIVIAIADQEKNLVPKASQPDAWGREGVASTQAPVRAGLTSSDAVWLSRTSPKQLQASRERGQGSGHVCLHRICMQAV